MSLHVEKILAEGEQLPDSWACDGTTGYDFMDQTGAWLHDPAAAPAPRTWQALGGDSRSFDRIQQDARGMMLRQGLHADFQRLLRSAQQVLQPGWPRPISDWLRWRAHWLHCCGITAPTGPIRCRGRVNERRWWTLPVLRARRWTVPHAALDLLLQALPGQAPAETELRVRFGQLAAPLNAKSVEDTGFYRYFRLLSRNEVGSDPQRLGMEGRELLNMQPGACGAIPGAACAGDPRSQARGRQPGTAGGSQRTCTVEWRTRCGAGAGWRPRRRDAVAGVPRPMRYGRRSSPRGRCTVPRRRLRIEDGAMADQGIARGKRVSSWSDPDVAVEEAAQWLHALLDGAPLQPVREALATFVARISRRAPATAWHSCACSTACPACPTSTRAAKAGT